MLRAEVHALGDVGEGVVECYASVFDVEFMEGSSFFQRKVRIEKGAFEESLQSHDSFPVMWEHDWDAGPIGHSLDDKEDDHGLWGRIQLYTDSDRGRNIWRSMEAGAIFDWSIGFYPQIEETQKRKKNDDDNDSEQETIVIYKKVDLAERSVVVRGANPDTETISVQSAIAAGLRVARGGVVQEVTIDGVRYGSEILGGGLAVQELYLDGTRYWAVPVCQSAIAPHGTDVVDEAWDGPAEEAKIPNTAGATTMRRMYAWNDPDKDADAKAAYKFPHHKVIDGRPTAANVSGVRNALARLPQSSVPTSDHEGVRRHLQRHLDDFKEPEEEALSWVPGAERLLERDSFRKIFRVNR